MLLWSRAGSPRAPHARREADLSAIVLHAEERRFLRAIERAVAANPFSDERAAIDRELAGAHVAPDRALEPALARLRAALHALAARGGATLADFREADRPLLRAAFLFDIFHRFAGRFDDLIRAQTRSADACRVPFAPEALVALAERGFAPHDALRYFAIFYQLRRAFFFIHDALVGRSAAMKSLRLALWNNVFTRDVNLYERHLWNRMEDFSTLLLGETGSGKGAAAAAIGRSGFIPYDERRGAFAESFTASFCAVNLSQFSAALIESELFGHRKGAFTGAVDSHEGVFARCSPHGAIFLDEIGDAAPPIQIKLLKVLQEREFSPVGSHERRRFHGRVIAASHRSLEDLRRQGLFRDDFFYRLCTDVIRVPPLRQRLAEDPAEMDDLLSVLVARILGRPDAELCALVRRTLDRHPGRGYAWPGNVRELEQAVRRILLNGRYDGERPEAAADPQARLLRGLEAGTLSAEALLGAYCALLYRRHGSYEEVARRAGLDRRTVRKYVERARREQDAAPPPR